VPDETSKSALTDTSLLLAGGSALAYLTTYIYEYAYCSSFGVPGHLISPGIPTMLLAAASIGGILLSVLALLGLTAPLVRRAQDPKRSSHERFFYFSNALLLIAGIVTVASYGFPLRAVGWWALGVVIFNLFLFGPVLFLDRHKPLSERFASSPKPEDPLNFASAILEPFPRYVSGAVLVCLAAFGTAFEVGRGEASRKEQYPTLASAPSFAVIRTYGDLVIAAGYNRETKLLTGELKFLSLKDTKELDVKVERIGPLGAAEAGAAQSQSLPTTSSARPASQSSNSTPSTAPRIGNSAPKL
jgi:hypothetical protein